MPRYQENRVAAGEDPGCRSLSKEGRQASGKAGRRIDPSELCNGKQPEITEKVNWIDSVLLYKVDPMLSVTDILRSGEALGHSLRQEPKTAWRPCAMTPGSSLQSEDREGLYYVGSTLCHPPPQATSTKSGRDRSRRVPELVAVRGQRHGAGPETPVTHQTLPSKDSEVLDLPGGNADPFSHVWRGRPVNVHR